jgi:ABC-type transport system substrate-binding protein
MIVKRIMIALACALTAPLAFAQTSTTATEQTTTTAPATATTTETTTYSAGSVTTYEPGKTIVVRSEEGPVTFALGTAARIVNGAGKIVTAPLRAGRKVRVYYTGTGEKRVVERVLVED